MNDSCLDAIPRPGISTFPIKHQILTIRLSLQLVFVFADKFRLLCSYILKVANKQLYYALVQ